MEDTTHAPDSDTAEPATGFRWTPHGGAERVEWSAIDRAGFARDAVHAPAAATPMTHPWNEPISDRPANRGPSPFASPFDGARADRRPSPGLGDRPESRFARGDGGSSGAGRPAYHYPADDVSEPVRGDKPRRLATTLVAVFAGLLGAASTVGVLWALGAFDRQTPPQEAAAPSVTVIERVRTELVQTAEPSSTAVAVARKVVPSIVRVEVGDATSGSFSAFGSGSGVVLTRDGYIATNNHVVEDAGTTRVVFQDGRTYLAEIVGTDALTDLAVLKITARGLTPIDIGATGELEIGETAIAVGNPLALSGGASLTVGVLSAFNREVEVGPSESLYGMLQTDAPITQGSSGGALVDDAGRLIGITTAIGVSSAGAEGIGFAIPVELVVRITDEIIETGTVRHAFLGILGKDFIDEAEDGALVPAGAIIDSFPDTGSAAEAAGLQAGDRIVGLDGGTVSGMQDLINGLRMYRVGETVELSVVRGEEQISATVVLEERPPEQ